MIDKLKNYIYEVKAELKKVTWPEKKVLKVQTLVIVLFMIIMAIYFGIVDVIFSKLISLILR
ncbi:MAG: preprotein translocase subunit SecE [Candidatus Ratteibacteria bacterium]